MMHVDVLNLLYRRVIITVRQNCGDTFAIAFNLGLFVLVQAVIDSPICLLSIKVDQVIPHVGS